MTRFRDTVKAYHSIASKMSNTILTRVSKSSVPNAFKKPGGGNKKRSPMKKAFPGDKAAERAFAFGDKTKDASFPANKVPEGAFGEVDKARVAKLKANPKRPAPLKRKLKAKLPKGERKKIVEARKEAKDKYQERSESFRQDRVILKNRFKAMQNRTARKMSEWATRLHAAKMANSQTEKKKSQKNFTLIYSVGPQHEDRRKCFREFRRKKYAELKKSGSKSSDPILVLKTASKTMSKSKASSMPPLTSSRPAKHSKSMSPQKMAAKKQLDKAQQEIQQAKKKFNDAQEKLGEAQKKLHDAKRAMVTAR